MLSAIALCGVATAELPLEDAAIDFQRQVRPILAAKCFTCHGPDEDAREADLRLDLSDDAVADRGGYRAIEPGDHAASEIWLRITSDDDDMRMPPAGPQEPLTPEQIDTIARWIDQGGRYETHWAFLPPTPQVPPQVDASASPIDAFIDDKLRQAGLEASEPADRYALVRRVYLDLIGVPPTPAQADAFVRDDSPTAYLRLVDQLLATPEYAERWARPWLDLARYADTNGYEKDRPRTIWPFRDWVLEAINEDMPFDQFSIHQLAGDMLPEADDRDRIATGFHRNTMLNEEGGIDPEEFRFHAMTDRVAATGTVWMGLTVGCAQCHTHKYDPITHTDYFALFALLNGGDDIEMEIDDPATVEQRESILAEIRRKEDDLLAGIFGDSEPAADESAGELRSRYEAFIARSMQAAADWQVMTPTQMTSTLPKLRVLDDGSILASGDVTKREVYTLRFDPPADGRAYRGIRLEALPHDSLPARGPGMAFYEGRRGDFFLSELRIEHDGADIGMHDASAGYGKISIGSGSADAANVIDGEGSTGWSTSGAEGTANRWVANFEQPFRPTQPFTIEMIFERHFAAPLGRFRISLAPDAPDNVRGTAPAAGREADDVSGAALAAGRKADDVSGTAPAAGRVYSPLAALPVDADDEATLLAARRKGIRVGDLPAKPTDDSMDRVIERLRREFLYREESLAEARKPLEALKRSLPEPVRTLVMRERPEEDVRVTKRYHRGEFLHPREDVDPAIPQIFADSSSISPRNRYELALWLVSDDNPLFARVTVDRAWRELFGRGIVHTAGDYGTQSEPPSHPELLDYLAVRFASEGMSLKRLHREIVTSDAYRRSSHRRPDLMQADPDNRLLATGPRRRLEGERIRDTMLAASGLLARHLGGPSVFPPQPASVTARAYGSYAWNASEGGDRYRRSIYTFAKRTAPFAALAVFDGPTGETCLPRRESSNSPLQALTLLNDAMYIEMAEAIADEVLRDVEEANSFNRQPKAFAENGNDRPTTETIAATIFRRLLTRPPTDDELGEILDFYAHVELPDERTKWTAVARALMNLDEVITTP